MNVPPSNDDETPVRSKSEKALAAVPVTLTVLATVLAGLSSSEMTLSMYYRSLAAQEQSKAGSQWAFFQAKRIRGTTLEVGVESVRATADTPPFDATAIKSSVARIEAAIRESDVATAERIAASRRKLDALLNDDSMRYLSSAELPAIIPQHVEDPALAAVVKAVRSRQTEAQTSERVSKVSATTLAQALEAAEANADAFDKATAPTVALLKQLDGTVAEVRSAVRSIRPTPNEAAAATRELTAALWAARQDFTARRYAREAAYNQESAEWYEVSARYRGVESDRHRTRSRNFFYAMLSAQAGVTVASLALARSRNSPFWAIAGVAGLMAVAFGAYVYLAL